MTAAQLMAHRGYATRYPENTREAISAAVSAGAELVEFDVQLTADEVPILLHDVDFMRTGNDPRNVLTTDLAAVESISVAEATKFGDTFAGVTAPTLADVVEDLATWPHVTAFVELKRHSLEHFGVATVLDAVTAVLQPVIDQCVLISFNADCLYAWRERMATPIGWALRQYDAEHLKVARDLAPEYLFCNQTRLPHPNEALWVGAWDWVVYEIVDPEVARALLDRGVAIIETKDYADMAIALRD